MPSSFMGLQTFAGSSYSQLHLAFGLPDLLDPNLDRVAQAEGTSPTPANEPRLELVDLVEVARQPPRREHALEHVAEADEEARADHPRDLAREGRLPAALEE